MKRLFWNHSTTYFTVFTMHDHCYDECNMCITCIACFVTNDEIKMFNQSNGLPQVWAPLNVQLTSVSTGLLSDIHVYNPNVNGSIFLRTHLGVSQRHDIIPVYQRVATRPLTPPLPATTTVKRYSYQNLDTFIDELHIISLQIDTITNR